MAFITELAPSVLCSTAQPISEVGRAILKPSRSSDYHWGIQGTLVCIITYKGEDKLRRCILHPEIFMSLTNQVLDILATDNKLVLKVNYFLSIYFGNISSVNLKTANFIIINCIRCFGTIQSIQQEDSLDSITCTGCSKLHQRAYYKNIRIYSRHHKCIGTALNITDLCT